MLKNLLVRLHLCALLFAASLPASAYQKCERYEYGELKSMPSKQFSTEFCKTYQRLQDIYQTVGETALDNDTRVNDQAIRDRDVCDDILDKFHRQAAAKKVKLSCPNVKQVDPLKAALEKANKDLEKAQQRSK